MLKKLKSRKFLMALLSVIVGIATMVGASDAVVTVISGIGMVVIPVVIYIATEGKVDAAAVSLTTEAIEKIVEIVTKKEESEDEISK